MCSWARTAAADALAALCEAAGVAGGADPLEQAAMSRPATPVTAVIAARRPGPALVPRRAAPVCWPSALSLCRTADPPVADHSLLGLACYCWPSRLVPGEAPTVETDRARRGLPSHGTRPPPARRTI